MGTRRGVLFCTDLVMYGHNIPKCRAVLSCGLRKMLQYNKAFGLVLLNTMIMSREEWYQLCGRIDRGKVQRGDAFTFIPVRSGYRPKVNDLTVTYDDTFILSQLADHINEAKNMEKVHEIASSDIAQFGICSQVGYAFELFKVNYCISVEGPTNLVDLKDFMELMTTKLGPAPTRWKMILLQLWLMQMNKPDATREDALPIFERLVLKTLKYVAFTEEPYVWMYSLDEAKWADQVIGGGGTHAADILNHYFQAKSNDDYTLGEYGGEGYQSMNFLDKLFSISLAPVTPALRCGCWPGGERWRQVMPTSLARRKLLEVGNLVSHFVGVNLGYKAILRNHFRLLSEDRWENADEEVQIQLALCNTRPLQVAKFTIAPGQTTTPHFAKTIVTKQIVFFDDSHLCWNDNQKWGGYRCRCAPAKKIRTRFIYFGMLSKRKEPTRKGDLFRVRATMAVAHEIGCCLEEWFIRTGAHLGANSVPMDITHEQNDSSGIRLDLVKEALDVRFEEKI